MSTQNTTLNWADFGDFVPSCDTDPADSWDTDSSSDYESTPAKITQPPEPIKFKGRFDLPTAKAKATPLPKPKAKAKPLPTAKAKATPLPTAIAPPEPSSPPKEHWSSTGGGDLSRDKWHPTAMSSTRTSTGGGDLSRDKWHPTAMSSTRTSTGGGDLSRKCWQATASTPKQWVCNCGWQNKSDSVECNRRSCGALLSKQDQADWRPQQQPLRPTTRQPRARNTVGTDGWETVRQ
jgi:hypothetical protein